MGSGADWDPSTLRGTKLAALVVVPDDDHGRDHTRTSSNNTNPVDALFESWRAFPKPREVCVKMRCPGSASGLGQVAVPVQVIVRIVGPTSPQQERERDQERELPPFVMPAPLMYSVRLASVPSPSPHALSNSASTSTFTKLDPANGESESWQYEISQLKFANERLVEEIRALERAAAVGGGNGTERERVVYMNPASTSTFDSNSTSNSDPQQQQQQQQWGYSASAPLMYQLPMKRPWDRRE
ncbi:hypothetical protein C8F01DRAFT_175413 [Mycena amicta]|nr:hypothetical protein C8F01DRAFT_175413 [Mycena amicta]